jgi:hypothetical protein
MEISVISPCYGAPTLLRELVRQIEETVSKLTKDYEIYSIMGIIAVYIGNIFDEVKHRPSYIIDEKLNFS